MQSLAIDDQLAVVRIETTPRGDAADYSSNDSQIAIDDTSSDHHRRVTNQQVAIHALT
jgi:hypothetical protein